jgi:hypothetical protein
MRVSGTAQRINRLIDHATLVLGDLGRANDWVQSYSASLAAKPIQLAESEEGLNRALLHLSGISRHRDSAS